MSDKKKEEWERFEHDMAKAFGGKVINGSGRYACHKGDFKNDKFLGDCKCTASQTYQVSHDFLQMLTMWAINESKMPIMPIRFLSQIGEDIDVVVMPSYVYMENGGIEPDTYNKRNKVHALRGEKVKDIVYAFSLGGIEYISIPVADFLGVVHGYQNS